MFNWFTKRAPERPEPVWVAGPAGMLITGQDGFIDGTHLVSNLGWRRVEDLRVGDKILTFDNGMSRIVEIQREILNAGDTVIPESRWPLLVPEGALLNRRSMKVLPDQGIFVESDLVCDRMGEPFAVIPAAALIGFRGIAPVRPDATLAINTLTFVRDEVVYAEGGMLAHCPSARSLMAQPEEPLYRLLNPEEARALVAEMQSRNGEVVLGWKREELPAQKVRPQRPVRALN
jgi:hypothetical protein